MKLIRNSDEIWNELETDLLNLTTNETPFFIIGDMNGRVGECSEFCQLDKDVDINYINNITRSISETSRRNCDEQTNKIGEKIIHLCKSYDMQIANGRMRGDLLGNFNGRMRGDLLGNFNGRMRGTS